MEWRQWVEGGNGYCVEAVVTRMYASNFEAAWLREADFLFTLNLRPKCSH